jgi:hypothetical protein
VQVQRKCQSQGAPGSGKEEDGERSEEREVVPELCHSRRVYICFSILCSVVVAIDADQRHNEIWLRYCLEVRRFAVTCQPTTASSEPSFSTC